MPLPSPSMDEGSERDGGWWLPESRVNPEKIELEISLGWLSAKLTNFAVSAMSKMGGSSRYAKRVLVSKEDGVEIHYKDAQSGLEEIVYFQSNHISAVHRWYSKSKTSEGNESTSTNYAIVANSVVHTIPGSKKQIRQLCEILELDLQTKSPMDKHDFPERTLFE